MTELFGWKEGLKQITDTSEQVLDKNLSLKSMILPIIQSSPISNAVEVKQEKARRTYNRFKQQMLRLIRTMALLERDSFGH